MLKRRNNLSTRLTVENLEWRNLLSGTPLTASAVPGEVEQEHHSEGDDDSSEVETHLRARLTDSATPGAVAKVQYESEQQGTGPIKQSFTVQVSGAAANATLDVTVDSIVVGQVVTDAKGRGRLSFSDHGNKPGNQPFPVDFPAITETSTITVGSLTGQFTAQHEHSGDNHGTPTTPPTTPPAASRETHLSSSLADVNVAAVSGKAEYESETEHGRIKISFTVQIRGAVAGQAYDVSIDGVVVGAITTDALGNGKLKLTTNPKSASQAPLPADFPAVSAGSVIKVGSSISGTLAAPLAGGHDSHDDHGDHRSDGNRSAKRR